MNVYFDNAATTYPKPPAVVAAMSRAMVSYGANPGRAGHKMSVETSEQVFKAREKCAAFFGAKTENTVFTLNCTHALNIAIKGILTRNAHIITTDLEHNAVIRPIYSASKDSGITFSVAQVGQNDEQTLKNLERLINARTKAIVCTAASNVSGRILPIKRIAALCAAYNLCFIVDMAQYSGIRRAALSDGMNIICTAGHKSLYGPMGTGLLITDGRYRLKTLIEGGTAAPQRNEQPDSARPFRCGTINTSGAIALGAGISFIEEKGLSVIEKHESMLCDTLYNELLSEKSVVFLSDITESGKVPILSFNIGGIPSQEAANLLSKAGFYLRGGFHCAFLPHKKYGTYEHGTVRFSPSLFNTKNETYALAREIKRISRTYA